MAPKLTAAAARPRSRHLHAGERRRGGLGLLSVLLVLAVLGLGLCWTFGLLVQVRSSDMAPTLRLGDWVYALKHPVGSREPEVGEVLAFRLAVEGLRYFPPDRRPDLPTQVFVGRVIGAPGDRVATRGGTLELDGQRVRSEPRAATYADPQGRRPALSTEWLGPGYRTHWVARGDREPELPPTRVEPGRYLLLGDYRSEAYDSRYWGSLRREDLLGPVLLVVFSRDPRTGGIRWSRTGHAVD